MQYSPERLTEKAEMDDRSYSKPNGKPKAV